MTRVLDHKSVEEALRRAAHKAVNGTREERSGKFLADKPVKAETGRQTGAAPAKRRVAG